MDIYGRNSENWYGTNFLYKSQEYDRFWLSTWSDGMIYFWFLPDINQANFNVVSVSELELSWDFSLWFTVSRLICKELGSWSISLLGHVSPHSLRRQTWYLNLWYLYMKWLGQWTHLLSRRSCLLKHMEIPQSDQPPKLQNVMLQHQSATPHKWGHLLCPSGGSFSIEPSVIQVVLLKFRSSSVSEYHLSSF